MVAKGLLELLSIVTKTNNHNLTFLLKYETNVQSTPNCLWQRFSASLKTFLIKASANGFISVLKLNVNPSQILLLIYFFVFRIEQFNMLIKCFSATVMDGSFTLLCLMDRNTPNNC